MQSKVASTLSKFDHENFKKNDNTTWKLLIYIQHADTKYCSLSKFEHEVITDTIFPSCGVPQRSYALLYLSSMFWVAKVGKTGLELASGIFVGLVQASKDLEMISEVQKLIFKSATFYTNSI